QTVLSSATGQPILSAKEEVSRMSAKLERIFRCPDQSALIHDCVSSEDAAPGAWSYQSAPQSPLGRTSFLEVLGSEVVTITQGQVYTSARRGRLIEHQLTSHDWLPWRYTGRGAEIAVVRTVTRNQYVA